MKLFARLHLFLIIAILILAILTAGVFWEAPFQTTPPPKQKPVIPCASERTPSCCCRNMPAAIESSTWRCGSAVDRKPSSIS